MKDLTKGITVAGVRNFGNYYARRPFAGRVDAMHSLDVWMQSSNKPVLVCAEAGRGKSALLVHWALRQLPTANIVWIPISLRFGTARTTTFEEAVYGRVQVVHPQTEQKHWKDRLAQAANNKKIIVVIDGIDEAVDSQFPKLLQGLNGIANIHVVVSARKGVHRTVTDWAKQLGWVDYHSLELRSLSRDEVKDVVGSSVSAEKLVKLYQSTQGDPLLVSMYVEQGGFEGESLESWVDGWWKQQQQLWNQTDPTLSTEVEQLLSIFANAMGPVEEHSLEIILGKKLNHKAIEALHRFIVLTPEGYVFSHPRLNDFFRERQKFEQQRHLDQHIVTVGKDLVTRWKEERKVVPPYFVRWIGMHFERAGDDEGLQQLADVGWLDAHQLLDSSDIGFRQDLRIATWRACLRVVEASSEQARKKALLDHALCTCVRLLLQSQDQATSGTVLAAYVSHGLKSEDSAIQSVDRIEGSWEHKTTAQDIIPVVSDSAFRRWLDDMTPGLSWPVSVIAKRYRELGDYQRAFDWVTGEYTKFSITTVVSELEYFPVEWREKLVERIRGYDCSLESCQGLISTVIDELTTKARGLPVSENIETLETADAILRDFPEDDIYIDEEENPDDPRLIMANAWSEAHRPERAVYWLGRVAARLVPNMEEQTTSDCLSGPWGKSLAIAVQRLGSIPSELVPYVDRSLSRRKPDSWMVECIVQLLPVASPERKREVELGLLDDLKAGKQELECLPTVIMGPVSEHTRQRAVDGWIELVIKYAREDRGKHATYEYWYSVYQYVLKTLQPIEPYLPVERIEDIFQSLCDWAHAHYHEDSRGRGLKSPWIIQAVTSLLTRCPELQKRVYQQWITRLDVPIWHAQDWTKVVEFPQRQARMVEEFRAAKMQVDSRFWHGLLLKALAQQSDNRDDWKRWYPWLYKTLPPSMAYYVGELMRVLPSEFHAEFVNTLLQDLPADPTAKYHVVTAILPHLSSVDLKRTLLEFLLTLDVRLHIDPKTWWLKDASTIVPADKLEEIKAKLRVQNDIDEEDMADAMPPDPQELYHAVFQLNSEGVLQLVDSNKVAKLLGIATLEQIRPTLDTLAASSDARIHDTVLYFLKRNNALELAHPFVKQAGAVGKLDYWLATHSLEESLREIFSREPTVGLNTDAVAYSWVLDRIKQRNRVWEHCQLVRESSPRARLIVWDCFWAELSPEQQQHLHPDYFAACQQVQQTNTALNTLALSKRVLSRLTDDEVKLLWLYDGAPSTVTYFPEAYYQHWGVSLVEVLDHCLECQLGQLLGAEKKNEERC